MLKMMKYEIKRNRLSYFFMLAVLLLLELVFSVGMLLEKEVVFSLSIIGLMFFGFAGILFVAINGTNIYSKDLKKKTGYMVFMTPISSYKVLGAKLLAVFCSSLVLLIIYVGIGLIDVFWVIEAYSIKEFEPLIKQVFGIENFTFVALAEYGVWIVVYGYIILNVVISFGYLSISLAATLLQNKKGKGLIADAIFIGLLVLLGYVEGKLFGANVGDTFTAMLIAGLPGILFELACGIAAFWGAAYMLEHKINL